MVPINWAPGGGRDGAGMSDGILDELLDSMPDASLDVVTGIVWVSAVLWLDRSWKRMPVWKRT